MLNVEEETQIGIFFLFLEVRADDGEEEKEVKEGEERTKVWE